MRVVAPKVFRIESPFIMQKKVYMVSGKLLKLLWLFQKRHIAIKTYPRKIGKMPNMIFAFTGIATCRVRVITLYDWV